MYFVWYNIYTLSILEFMFTFTVPQISKHELSGCTGGCGNNLLLCSIALFNREIAELLPFKSLQNFDFP
jgi:hypothetical protein